MSKKFGLAIDGGGVGGVGTGVALKYMAKHKFPKPDFISGTSVGAIIGAYLAIGGSYESVSDVVIQQSPTIFKSPPWWDVRFNRFTSKYDNKGAISVLKSLFGDKKMNQTEIPLFIVALDIESSNPKVFDANDDLFIWEAVLASMSAPTYFPQYKVYLDGGLVANNPVLNMLGAMSRNGLSTLDEVVVLNISSNGSTPSGFTTNGKLFPQYIVSMVSSIMSANESGSAFIAEEILKDRYFRIDPPIFPTFDLDSVAEMPRLVNQWSNWIGMYGYTLINWATKNEIIE